MTTYVDSARLAMERCDIFGGISEEPDRLTRRYGTEEMRRANAAVAEWMRAAGMQTRSDAIGNLIGRYEGSSPDAKTFLLGSHLDTVRDAGKYDGPLGVMVALACVERLHARGERLPFALEVYAFADEEGLRYRTLTSAAASPPAASILRCWRVRTPTASRWLRRSVRSAAIPTVWPRARAVPTSCSVTPRSTSSRVPYWKSAATPSVSSPRSRGRPRRHRLHRRGGPRGNRSNGDAPRRALCRRRIHARGRDAGEGIGSLQRTICGWKFVDEFYLAKRCDKSSTKPRQGIVATVGRTDGRAWRQQCHPRSREFSLDVRHPDDKLSSGGIEPTASRRPKRSRKRRGFQLDWRAGKGQASVACSPRPHRAAAPRRGGASPRSKYTLPAGRDTTPQSWRRSRRSPCSSCAASAGSATRPPRPSPSRMSPPPSK